MIRNKSEKEENRRIPRNVRKEINDIVLKIISRKHKIVPSPLTSGVSPPNPYFTKYMKRHENKTMMRSIARIENRDNTLLDKKFCIISLIKAMLIQIE
jgi:hypothetical protein